MTEFPQPATPYWALLQFLLFHNDKKYYNGKFSPLFVDILSQFLRRPCQKLDTLDKRNAHSKSFCCILKAQSLRSQKLVGTREISPLPRGWECQGPCGLLLLLKGHSKGREARSEGNWKLRSSWAFTAWSRESLQRQLCLYSKKAEHMLVIKPERARGSLQNGQRRILCLLLGQS